VQTDEPRRGPEGPFLERWVLPYLRDSTLWPILLVLVAHVVAFLAPLILWAARDGGAASLATVGAFAALTGAGFWLERRQRGGIGAFSALLVCTWLLAGALAAVGHHTAIL
jgi:hypothetical protein